MINEMLDNKIEIEYVNGKNSGHYFIYAIFF